MSYRITRGDLKITKNVLNETLKRLGKALALELHHFEYQTDCPSYDSYQNVLDILIYLDSNTKDLTN